MHLSDDTQLHHLKDYFRTFYLKTNPDYHEQYRLPIFHRPIFNEIYVTTIKNLVGNHLEYLRWFSLGVHLLNLISTYLLIFALTSSARRAIVSAAFVSLNFAYFYGLYEFGISFSLLLTLWVILSLFFTIKASQAGRNQLLYACSSVLCCFLALFTKESAIVLPGVLFIILCIQLFFINKNIPLQSARRLKKSTVAFMLIGWFFVEIIYILTRIYKLGNIFSIAAGIETKITLASAIEKIKIYSLLSLGVPAYGIPEYMFLPLSSYPLIWQIIAMVFCFIFLILFLYNLKIDFKKNVLLLIPFTIFMVPILKVSRNSPYYADILVPVILLLFIQFKFPFSIPNQIKNYLVILSILYFFSANILFQTKTLNSMGIWIVRGERHTQKIIDGWNAQPNVIRNASSIKLLSSFSGREESWFYNHGRIGAFGYNLGINPNRFDVLKTPEQILPNSVLLDFYHDSTSSHSSQNNTLSSIVLQASRVPQKYTLNAFHKLHSNNEISCKTNDLLVLNLNIKKEIEQNSLKNISFTYLNSSQKIAEKTYELSIRDRKTDGTTKIFTLVPEETTKVKIEYEGNDKETFNTISLEVYSKE